MIPQRGHARGWGAVRARCGRSYGRTWPRATWAILAALAGTFAVAGCGGGSPAAGVRNIELVSEGGFNPSDGPSPDPDGAPLTVARCRIRQQGSTIAIEDKIYVMEAWLAENGSWCRIDRVKFLSQTGDYWTAEDLGAVSLEVDQQRSWGSARAFVCSLKGSLGIEIGTEVESFRARTTDDVAGALHLCSVLQQTGWGDANASAHEPGHP